jgi:Flp pilus assembly protein TadG
VIEPHNFPAEEVALVAGTNTGDCQMLGLLRRLLADRSAGTMTFMALGSMTLIGCIGASVDVSRAYMVKARLSQAVDAAAIAGGRVMAAPSRDADVQMFFAANFPAGYLGVTPAAPTIAVDGPQTSITVGSSADVPMAFLGAFGFSTMTVHASATATIARSNLEIAMVLDNTMSMLSNSKLENLRTAATNFINTVFAGQAVSPYVNLGIVPFVTSVNIGASRAAWTNGPNTTTVNVSSMTRLAHTITVTTATPHGFRSGDLIDISGATPAEYNGRQYIMATGTHTFTYRVENFAPHVSPATGAITARFNADYPAGSSWRGCVEERDAPYDTTQADVSPLVRPFRRLYWQSTLGTNWIGTDGLRVTWYRGGAWVPATGDNEWGTIVEAPNTYDVRGPNMGCGHELLPLQNNRDVALAQIAGLQAWARGGTHTAPALAWGWRMLSPNYRGLWGSPTPSTLPVDYNANGTQKIIVFMTDGRNTFLDNNSGLPGCAGISNPCHLESDGDHTGYGRLSAGRLGTTNAAQAVTNINAHTTQVCTAIRNAGILIYAILLQENDPTTQQIYRDCAGEGRFFMVDSDELNQAFQLIAGDISRLRLSR